MSLQTLGIIFDELTSDPGSPSEGQVWYNTTENRFKCFRNGSVESFSDLDELNAHIADTNPHGVTLEEARTAGNTLAGPINMGGNAITNVAGPSAATDAANQQFVLDQINQKLEGFDWQESVIDKDLSTPPGSPATGDRYIVAAGATGAWVGEVDSIAEWDGSAWVFAQPNEGFTTRVMDENIQYVHDGTSWGPLTATLDHGALTGLTDIADHPGYLDLGGTRTMSGSLNMGSNNITNVGTVDGVDVSAHAGRHITGGADEIDGDQLDIDFTPSNYTPSTAPAEVTNADHLSAHLAGIDTALLSAGSALQMKAGSVAAGTFTGNPKTATVTFASAFATIPTVTGTAEITAGNGRRYNISVSNITVNGFTLHLGSNNTANLASVKWQAIAVGES